MRELIIERIKPVVQRVAEDLADLVVAKIEAHLLVVRDSLEVAVSAVASELAGEADQGDEVADAHQAPTSPVGSEVAVASSPTSTGAVRAPRRCKKCREPGHRADRCPTLNATPPPVNDTPAVVNATPVVVNDADENDEEDDAPAPRVTRARSPFVSIPPPLLESRIASPRSRRVSRHAARRTRTAPPSSRTRRDRAPSILMTSPS